MGRRCCGTSSPGSSPRLALALGLLLALLLPGGLSAQRLAVQGDAREPAARLLHELAGRESYRVIARDTLLPADFRAPGDLVIIGADVRLEGTVEGDVAVLGGNLFLRPGARVEGGIATAAQGNVLGSAKATIGGEVLDLPVRWRARLSRAGELYTLQLTPPPTPSLVSPTGLFGLRLPTYNRVDGLTVHAGLQTGFGVDSGPRLRASVAYHTARNALGGRATLRVPLGGRFWASATAARATLTNEEWIRGDLANSLAALAFRSDARNYYRSDFAVLTLAQSPPEALEAGKGFVAPFARLRAEDDESLDAREPWSLFGEEWRPNPPVFEGTLTSVTAGAAAGWRGRTSRFAGNLAVEHAFTAPDPVPWGEIGFTHLVADGRWESLALWNHRVVVSGHLLRTLGPDPAPPQRWSFVGGPGTLSTLEFGALRGDNLVFLESSYAAPLPRLRIPLVGEPALVLRLATGTAWVTETEIPRWAQSLGAGLQLRLLEAMLFVDPARRGEPPTLSVSLSLPG